MSLLKPETIDKRMQYLRKGCELRVAIEGRFTNLRIWTGKDANGKYPPEEHDTVFMRLDRANNYSVPLNDETILYLDKITPAMQELLQFGFKSPIENLFKIITITKDMPYRELVAW